MNKNIKKIKFLLVIVISILISSCIKNTSLNKKNYSISIGQSSNIELEDIIRRNYVVSMKNNGYVEDDNVKYNYINAKGNKNYAIQLANEFYKNSYDLIFTIGDNVTSAVYEKYKNENVPIVFAGVYEPKELGIADSKGNPTSNISGVKISYLAKEQLEFIKSIDSEIKNIGIIYTINDNIAKLNVDFLKFYATSVGIDIHSINIKSVNDLYIAFDSLSAKNIDCILTVKDNMVSNEFEKILEYADNENIPIFSNNLDEIKKGATLGLVIDGERVGEEATKITKAVLDEKKDIKTIQNVTVSDYKIYINENKIKVFYKDYNLENNDKVIVLKK